MKHLILLSDPPYGTERSFYGLRMAHALAKNDPEARGQKGAEAIAVPKACLLDLDGDIVRQLRAEDRARRHEGWICYHTEM